MNYKHIYMLIIEHAKSEEKLGIRKRGNGEYYEKHHILPKSLFPLWSKRKSNLVLLTAREHFFCHQLLIKIYPCNEMNYALTAFIRRPNADYCLSSKEYERLRKLFSETHSNYLKQHPEITSHSKGARWYNNGQIEKFTENCPEGFILGRLPFTTEAKYKMAQKKKGTKLSEKTKQKMKKSGGHCVGKRNNSFGKSWWTNGKENILASECPKDFWKGRTFSKETLEKMKTCHKNVVAWNKGMNKASQILYRESIKKK